MEIPIKMRNSIAQAVEKKNIIRRYLNAPFKISLLRNVFARLRQSFRGRIAEGHIFPHRPLDYFFYPRGRRLAFRDRIPDVLPCYGNAGFFYAFRDIHNLAYFVAELVSPGMDNSSSHTPEKKLL